KKITAEITACMEKYMFSKAGFGRLGQPEDKPANDTLYPLCLKTLTQGSLPSVLAIHDFMGPVIFAKLGGTKGQHALCAPTGSDVRRAYMFGDPKVNTKEQIEALRGRTARKGAQETSTAPGLMPEGSTDVVPRGKVQERERGADKWQMAEGNKPQFTIDL